MLLQNDEVTAGLPLQAYFDRGWQAKQCRYPTAGRLSGDILLETTSALPFLLLAAPRTAVAPDKSSPPSEPPKHHSARHNITVIAM